MRRFSPIQLSAWCLFLVGFSVAAQTPRSIDLQQFRTEISPGTVGEDARFLKALVPALTKGGPLSPTRKGEISYESIDVKIERAPKFRADGSLEMDEKGRPVIVEAPVLLVKGAIWRNALIQFLTWRKGFEEEWIRSASAEAKPKRSPLQAIFENNNLTRDMKVAQTLLHYRAIQIPKIPAPTPRPEFWPISKVMEMPKIGAQVQFNLRGGLVTVLDDKSSRVWVLPFPPELDPHRWMRTFEAWAEKDGLDRAAERIRKEVTKVENPPR